MVVTAVLAVGLFALPLAVLVAKYIIDDERSELTQVGDLTALTATADLAHGRVRATLPDTEAPTSTAFYDSSGARVVGTGPSVADAGVRAALAGNRVTGSAPNGDFVVDIP